MAGYIGRTLANRELEPIQNGYKISTRIASFAVLIQGLLIYASYSAVLTSYLAVNDLRTPIDNLEDLLESDMKLGLYAGSYSLDLFRNSSKDSIYRKVT